MDETPTEALEAEEGGHDEVTKGEGNLSQQPITRRLRRVGAEKKSTADIVREATAQVSFWRGSHLLRHVEFLGEMFVCWGGGSV